MTIQQLEYIVAVDKYRHFVTAAEKCFVTQATLSMMIKKLEDELNVKIFDRTKHPVITTQSGKKIIEQARIILKECSRMKELVNEENSKIEGEIRIGIIPTLSPYLLPLFLKRFTNKYPDLRLHISELTTNDIIEKLKTGKLDSGIIALPSDEEDIVENSLFTEEFVIYSPFKNYSQKYLHTSEIDLNRLWLMDEGHCMRNQVIKLCRLKNHSKYNRKLDLATSSIETLVRIVNTNEGLTVLPYLAIKYLPKSYLQHIYHFKPPVPARRIGLVSFRYFTKGNILKALKEEIINSLPDKIFSKVTKKIIKVRMSELKT
ncbi:MAG: LysR substrate-binding domain-containing protein [Ignavibacteria bacterium]|nr:LysR substrate-binding domain-containing protein [Ignavibacteria bacterium]